MKKAFMKILHSLNGIILCNLFYAGTNPEGGKDMESNPLSGAINLLNPKFSSATRPTTAGIYGMPDFSRVTI